MTTNPVMSITDEQIAEIEALAFKTHESTAGLSAYASATNPSKLLALISRLRAAERDAARYRWLRDRLVGSSFDWDDEGMAVLAFEMPDGVPIGADCDKNIDTAMKGVQQ